ncbi:MAG: hypothetical protein SFU86_01710 [Pirellulaceae bacterium]|nr:hypothetical protein [Pirellulaceae bacterium]
MPAPSRPLIQFSLQGLLVVTAMVGIALSFYRLAGPQAFVHYSLLLFAVGPWFAYLASECLPIKSRGSRIVLANAIMLVLFVGVLKLAESILRGPTLILVGMGAMLLWTPQYMIFFVWRLGDRA